MMLNSKKDVSLYIYILGNQNKNDWISTLVPYRINDDEIFFGPCKKYIREKIKKKFLKRKKKIDLKEENYEIYLAGINPAKEKKIRKLLFAGKIKHIFTFDSAWKYYSKRAKDDEDIKKMINGIKEKNTGKKYSPLHLKQINENGKIGYKHRTNEHEKYWIYDLLSDKEINRYKETHNLKHIKKIFKNDKDGIIFERDCCFSVENIFFSHKRNICTIELDIKFLNLIKNGLSSIRLNTGKGPDLISPFGYDVANRRYGRLNMVKLEGKNAIDFIEHIREKLQGKEKF